MSTRGTSRRSFLVNSAAGLSTVWVAANYPGILAAEQQAQLDAHLEAIKLQGDYLAFFTPEEAADIDAMASEIIPTDSTPGAHEARCLYFIDKALVTFAKGSKQVYRQGLKDLQAKTKELFPTATKFSALTSPQRIQVLQAIEKTPFFAAVREHTVTGFFADPKHGGNFNKVGWKYISFDDSLNFKPPFGYYDQQTRTV